MDAGSGGVSDPTKILRTPEIAMILADKDLDALASALNASGRYRVLRRLAPRPFIETPDGSETRLGLFLDVETGVSIRPRRNHRARHGALHLRS